MRLNDRGRRVSRGIIKRGRKKEGKVTERREREKKVAGT